MKRLLREDHSEGLEGITSESTIPATLQTRLSAVMTINVFIGDVHCHGSEGNCTGSKHAVFVHRCTRLSVSMRQIRFGPRLIIRSSISPGTANISLPVLDKHVLVAPEGADEPVSLGVANISEMAIGGHVYEFDRDIGTGEDKMLATIVSREDHQVYALVIHFPVMHCPGVDDCMPLPIQCPNLKGFSVVKQGK